MAVEHIIKCLPVYFDAIERGEKPFEVRRDDRGYQKGDTLRLRRYQSGEGYFRRDNNFVELYRKITYVLTGGQFGIEPGYVVLGLEDPRP